LNSDAVVHRLTAILSADAVGYSRLLAEDEVATVRTLQVHREHIAGLVRLHRGRVVDSPGDNLLAEFPSALDAARCAAEIQRAVEARNADVPPHRRMEFRIGVHLGAVMVEGERIYGEGINIAARLQQLADPGAVCVSASLWDQVRHKLGLSEEDLGEQALKNIPEPVRVYQIRPTEEAVRPSTTRRNPEALSGRGLVVTPLF
jgi:adenylate cyclase